MSELQQGCLEFSYEEQLKRSWHHEVLNFEVAVPKRGCAVDTFYVTDDNGDVVPAQFSEPVYHYEYKALPVTVSLIADFHPWQKRTWTLHYGNSIKPKIPETDLSCSIEGDSYLVSNSLIAVRTGRGKVSFDIPQSTENVPAPLLALRGVNGKWIGRGWLESPQRVIGYNISLVADGPIFKTVRSEYFFEGGTYTCTVTLRSGEDVVHIREVFDLGDPSPLRNSNFCFSLYEGFCPDTVRWAGRYDDPQFVVNNPAGGYEKQQEAYFPVDYDNPGQLLRLHGLFTWWSQGAGYFAAYRQDSCEGDFIGIFPERPGHWSNPTVIFLESTGNPDLVLRAPIRQPEQNWIVDGVDYLSPYYTGSVAPGTARNRGVREWGILLSRPVDAIAEDDDCNKAAIRIAQTRYGQNPLDKIKDWTLDWPDPGYEAYPRGFVTRQQLPALRDRVSRIPELQALLTNPEYRAFQYLVTQDSAIGDQLLHADYDLNRNFGAPTDEAGLLTRLRWSASRYLEFEGDLGIHTCMHHGNYNLVPAAPLFDVAMSVPEMTQDERREARALYAFLIYKLSDPDWLAYGSGFHLGTPNMPTMSLSIIGSSAAVIPEHPMAYDWMMRSAKNILDMLSSFVAPGGAWRECPHYQMDASLVGVIQSATVFKNAGFLDLFRNQYLKDAMLYHSQLLTPVDPRLGIRTMPAIGNGSHEPTSLYGRMAAGVYDSDTQFSKWMQWAWKAIGSQYWYAHDETVCNEDLSDEVPDMSSRFFPGFGAVMRSHFGDPQETYLLFRMGYQHEHYENDQGEIVLYAKGVPLLLDFGSQYEPLMQRPWMHNRISLNHKLDEQAQGEIKQANFLEAADACLGQMTITTLEEYPDDPKDRPLSNQPRPQQVISPVIWTRQVILVKHEMADGPHYVVLRDSFDGDGDDFSEFNLWCLADRVDVGGSKATFSGQHGVDVTTVVIDPKVEISTGSYGHTFIANCMKESFHKVNGLDAKWEETQHYIRLKRDDHKGYFCVIYPHAPADTVPTFSQWADGTGVSAEVDGEIHTVICAESHGIYEQGSIIFEGQRAIVRQRADIISLIVLSGNRLRIGDLCVYTPGPVAVTLTESGIEGESNLETASDVTMELPSGQTLTSAVVTAGGQQSMIPLITEACKVTVALPAGKCKFRLS